MIYEFGPAFMKNPKPKTRNRLAPEVLDCREVLRGIFTRSRNRVLLAVLRSGRRTVKSRDFSVN
ncbi:hypothetical protein AKJ62_02645 [candidate division MSBL1 archaeon SCGC-AAA259D14]|uniref:Uncharacterized protein n=1 Tax=candidate division MSBL1 archaeon SCGC-AAA259D14 TaxID=1698261 RepID=A0A133U609_9EURY|nr:hypothetical protein AKJ62_02645 [candidate division MSBL1 archaeon SCGC-AAA259D14]